MVLGCLWFEDQRLESRLKRHSACSGFTVLRSFMVQGCSWWCFFLFPFFDVKVQGL